MIPHVRFPLRTRFLALVLALAVVSLAPRAMAAVYFEEEFNGPTLDPTKWSVTPGGGVMQFEGGGLSLAAGCAVQLPYVQSVGNPFPTEGDFTLRVGFRYPDPQAGGNGFSVSTADCHGYACLAGAAVWQDFCCGGLRAVIGAGTVGLGGAPQTAYHVYEWRYESGVYSLYVDSEFKGSAPAARPIRFWFGHPPYAYCPWTTQEIDFIRVETFEPTPAAAESWGRVKAGYR